jgi:predicted esterase
MVITGANDPRVPPEEAEQIIKAVRAKGVPVWSLLAANEGHGHARKENRDYADLAPTILKHQPHPDRPCTLTASPYRRHPPET